MTSFLARRGEAAARLDLFIPPGENAPVWDLTITNRAGTKLDWKQDTDWACYFKHNLQAEFDREAQAVTCLYRHFHFNPHLADCALAWFAASVPAASIDCDRDAFCGAYRDERNPIGSASCEHGKIWLNTQSWSVISGLGTPEQQRTAMDAVHELLDTKLCGIRKLHPGFPSFPLAADPYSGYSPGCGENGAIFCHANTWAVIAATQYLLRIRPELDGLRIAPVLPDDQPLPDIIIPAGALKGRASATVQLELE